MRLAAHSTIALTAVLAAPAGWVVAEAAGPSDQYVRLLLQQGVEATGESIARFLRSLRADDDVRQHTRSLIARLGGDRYLDREAAMHELSRLPVLPLDLIEQAVNAKDPEIRWRARKAAQLVDRNAGQILYATYYVIRQRNLKGLAQPVLGSLPYCNRDYVVAAARRALIVTVLPSDTPVIRRSLHSKYVNTRIAAISALAKLDGPATTDDIQPLLKDADDRVRIAAAEALAGRGVRDVLPVLGRLLESTDPLIRSRSAIALRTLTGKKLGFGAYAEPQLRSKAVRAWQSWIDESGPTAPLLPLKKLPESQL